MRPTIAFVARGRRVVRSDGDGIVGVRRRRPKCFTGVLVSGLDIEARLGCRIWLLRRMYGRLAIRVLAQVSSHVVLFATLLTLHKFQPKTKYRHGDWQKSPHLAMVMGYHSMWPLPRRSSRATSLRLLKGNCQCHWLTLHGLVARILAEPDSSVQQA